MINRLLVVLWPCNTYSNSTTAFSKTVENTYIHPTTVVQSRLALDLMAVECEVF